MTPPKNRLPLAGSERSPMQGAREVGPADPNQKVEVTIRLKSRAGKKPIVSADVYSQLPKKRTTLSRAEYEQRHGADPADVTRVQAFARDHGLTVVETSPARRTVILSGTVAAMSEAFGVVLKKYEHPNGRYRGRTGAVQLPPDLNDIVEGVFGLDNRPQAQPHFRKRRGQTGIHAHDAGTSYTPPELAQLYDFPTGVDGTGQCIALIELGGGFVPADLNAYFNQLNLTHQPTLSAVSIGNGRNSPTGDPNGPDGEVMLDIEVAGSIAPGAKIVVCFCRKY